MSVPEAGANKQDMLLINAGRVFEVLDLFMTSFVILLILLLFIAMLRYNVIVVEETRRIIIVCAGHPVLRGSSS